MSENLSECDDQVIFNSNSQLNEQPKFEGVLRKWTNFIHGWQERYFVLKDGILSYYKSQNEQDIGCRGAICIQRAIIKLVPTDEYRFDISVGDCVWYLRGQYKELRDKWVEALEVQIHYIDSAYGSDNSLKKTGSVLSLGSISLSSSKKYSLKDRIAEIETFRDILARQLETLQVYFDNQALRSQPNDIEKPNALHEASISATNNVLLNNIKKNDDLICENKKTINPKINLISTTKNCSNQLNNNCSIHSKHQRHHSYSNPQFIHHSSQNKHHKRSFSHNSSNLDILKNESTANLFSGSQNSLNSKVFKSSLISLDFKGEAINFKATSNSLLISLNHCLEIMRQKEETKQVIESNSNASNNLTKEERNVLNCGPDFFEEGPNSKIKEDEFFDALDAVLDKKDFQDEEKRQLKLRVKELKSPSALPVEKFDHPLWPEIDKITLDQLYYARLEVGSEPTANGGNSSWQLFAQEGEMRLYKREIEIDGLVCDPLKAVHVVKGITAHEVCHHFFSPDVRWDWENTLETMKVLEEINGNTLILHQIHKRVLFAAQRDTVFWSHIRKVPIEQLNNIKNEKDVLNDVWIVCNNSNNYIDVPLGKCLRMKMTVSMTCETYIDKPEDEKEIKRDHLKCKIIYCSSINPGGWAPASVLRALYKREYPKFLKRFTQYVIDAQQSKSIMF